MDYFFDDKPYNYEFDLDKALRNFLNKDNNNLYKFSKEYIIYGGNFGKGGTNLTNRVNDIGCEKDYYPSITLCRSSIGIHRLIAFLFVPNPNPEIVDGLKADIICEDSKNNFILLVDLNIGEGDISEEKYKLIKEYDYNYLNVIIPRTIETRKELERYLIDEWGVVIDRSNGRKITYLKYYVNYPYGNAVCRELFDHYYNILINKYKSSPLKNRIICEFCFKNILLQRYLDNLQRNLKERVTDKKYKFIFKFKNIQEVVNYLNDELNMNYFPVNEKDGNFNDPAYRLLLGLNTLLQYYYKYKAIDRYTWNCEMIMGVVNGKIMCVGAKKAEEEYKRREDKAGLRVRFPKPNFKF